jgi:hypothetical protein
MKQLITARRLNRAILSGNLEKIPTLLVCDKNFQYLFFYKPQSLGKAIFRLWFIIIFLFVIILNSFALNPSPNPQYNITMQTFNHPDDKDTGINKSIIAPGATPVLISDQFSFTEGPATDKDGNVFLPTSPMIKYGNTIPMEPYLCLRKKVAAPMDYILIRRAILLPVPMSTINYGK